MIGRRSLARSLPAALVIACIGACIPRGAAGPSAIGVDDESALLARVAGCAHRSTRWVVDTYRAPSSTDGVWARLVACAGEPTCAALAKCSGIEIKGGSAAESECKPSCVDGIEVRCDGGPRVRVACALDDRVCSGRGPRCVQRGARPCDLSFVPRCDGARPVNCEDGEEVLGDDCSVAGLRCDPNAREDWGSGRVVRVAVCAGAGPACGGGQLGRSKPFQCDGAAIVSCVGGYVHRVECNKLVPGSECRAFGDADAPSFACMRDVACDPTDRKMPRCDGNTLTFCNAGRTARVDCETIGFRGCFGSGCVFPVE